MDIFLLHVAVLELRHSPDHQNCGYGRTTAATVSLKLNDVAVAPVLTTFGSDVAFSAQLNPEDRITVSVTPQNPDFHPIEGGFVFQGNGQFRRRADTAIERTGFAPPQSISFDPTLGLVPLNASLFQCYISNLNDVTAKVGGILSKAAGGVDVIAQLEAPETNHWLRFPPVPASGSPPQYELRQVDPRANIRCFELGGKVLPKLVMTTWPRSPANAITAGLPGLVMFHPFLSNYYVGSRYPFGKQHLWDAGLKYFGFRGLNPILSVYAGGKARAWRDVMDKAEEEMGLPHQMSAGGKRVAVVMPVNFGASIGKFASGDFLHTFCHEMNGHGLRSEEAYFDPPALGRWALSGFSSGNRILADVLNGNRGNRFIDGVVAEVYAMDPPPSKGASFALDKVCDAASAWLGRAPGDRRFRLYTQEPTHPQFTKFKVNPGDPLPRPAFVVPESAAANPADPGGTRRTVVSTPPGTVTAAARGLDPTFAGRFPGGYRGGQFEGHRLVNQTMFVDAMRRSGFPDIDGSGT